MPRRAKVTKKELSPDAKYHSLTVSRLINRVMLDGKKSKAEGIVYEALQKLEQQESKPPVAILEQALKNITPLLEVKARRVGGADRSPASTRCIAGAALAGEIDAGSLRQVYG